LTLAFQVQYNKILRFHEKPPQNASCVQPSHFSAREPAGGCLAFLLPRCHRGTDEATIRFNRDIRPILSDNCYSCHGPDKDKRKAKLRLDTHEGLFSALKERLPIAPGKPSGSEIYRRITSQDPDELMPRSTTGQKAFDAPNRAHKEMDRTGRPMGRPLGLYHANKARGSTRRKIFMASE